MNEHKKIRDLLTLAAAGLLDPREQREVEKHLQQCGVCSSEFGEWSRIAGALKELPIPQAPAGLVWQTQRILAQAALAKQNRVSRLVLALLIAFSWIVTVTTFGLMQLLNVPLAQWLDVSSTALWVAYIGLTWLATALAAGLLGKHWRQEGRTI